MRELAIHYFAASETAPARIRVSYRARKDAPAQSEEAPFDFTMSAEEQRLIQWYLEEYLLFPWGEFRVRAEKVEGMMKRIGRRLFETVFGDTAAIYALAAGKLHATRVVITADDPAGIAVPWELMCDPALGEEGALARLAHSFVRGQIGSESSPAPETGAGSSFNILMIISRPSGEDDAPFQSVAGRLLEVFRPHRDRVHLDILRPPTFQRLTEVLSEKPNFYHVLHFDGHGTFPQGSGLFYALTRAQGRLVFEGEGGGPQEVTGEEVGRLLAGKGVPIVALNACQSGMTHPEALYPSVGNQLLAAGAQGVVAMAYSVYVQTAGHFMAKLYEALVNGHELSRAVSLAREDLRAQPLRFSPIGEAPLQDWIVPILFEAHRSRVLRRRGGRVSFDPSDSERRQTVTGTEVNFPDAPRFGFVGRDNVILALERVFRRETIVLLEGMAGVGKTETAVSFARWRAETGALDGPAFFFHFGQYLPLALICDQIGQVLAPVIKEHRKEEWSLLTPGERRQAALGILRELPCLLIWDSFEQVAGLPTGATSAWTSEEQKELGDFLLALQGGQTKVLITSRRDEPWLGEFYCRAAMTGLSLAEAQELAVQVLRQSGLNSDQLKALPEYNPLLQYLQGNPLAIQTVMPELKSPQTTPTALLTSLQTGELKLSADDPTLGRKHSLIASIRYGLDALDPAVRERLAILGVFQGFVTEHALVSICSSEDAPAAVSGLGDEEWESVLSAAINAGLLRQIEVAHYKIHPALPGVIRSLLKATFVGEPEWLEVAYIRFYAEVSSDSIEVFQTEPSAVVSIFQAEENNLTHALRLARRHQLWDDAIAILYGLHSLFTTLGRWEEWDRLISEVATDCATADGQPLPGRELLWRAVESHRAEIAMYHRDFQTAQSIHLRNKEYFELTGDDRKLAATMNDLGTIAYDQHRFDQAEQWLHASLEIAERIGDERVQSLPLHRLGMIAHLRQQLDAAEEWYRKSLAIAERIGDRQGQAPTLHQLGNLACERGQLVDADRWYRRSLAIKQEIGNQRGQADSLHQLGVVAFLQNRFSAAEEWERQSLIIREQIGDALGQSQTLYQLGMIAQNQRQLEEAERWHRQSLALARQSASELGEAQNVLQLGILAERRGEADQAERSYKSCLGIFERIGDKDGQAKALHNMGNIAFKRGQWDEAGRCYDLSLSLKEQIGDEDGKAITLFMVGRIAQAQERFDEAESLYRQCLEIHQRLGDEQDEGILLHQMGRIAQEREQFDEAERSYRQSLELRRSIGDEEGEAGTLHQMGMIAELQGRLATALGFYEESAALLTRLEDDQTLPRVLESLARAQDIVARDQQHYPGINQLAMKALQQQAYEDADLCFRHCLAIAERLEDEENQAIILHNLGTVAFLRQNDSEAKQYFQQSLVVRKRHGDEHLQAITLTQLGLLEERAGNYAEATENYQRAEAIFLSYNDTQNLEAVRSALQRLSG